MANHPTVTYTMLVQRMDTTNQPTTEWVNVDVVLSGKSKAKANYRRTVVELVKEMYPGCVVLQCHYQ